MPGMLPSHWMTQMPPHILKPPQGLCWPQLGASDVLQIELLLGKVTETAADMLWVPAEVNIAPLPCSALASTLVGKGRGWREGFLYRGDSSGA